jgi:hypothetical protein
VDTRRQGHRVLVAEKRNSEPLANSWQGWTSSANKPSGIAWCLRTLAPGGIYVVDRNVPPSGRIEYFDFATRQSTPILNLEKPSALFGGLTLSPNGKSLLFGQNELDESYVMLVKSLR